MRSGKGLWVVLALVVVGLVWYGTDTYAQDKRACSHSKKASSCGQLQKSCAQAGQAGCPLAGKADDLLAKWKAVPQTLAGMGEPEQAKLAGLRNKCVEGNPAMGQMMATMGYLGRAVKLIGALDDQVCGSCQNCAKLRKVIDDGTFQSWERRHDLTVKAVALYSTAFDTMCAMDDGKSSACRWSCADVKPAAGQKTCSATCGTKQGTKTTVKSACGSAKGTSACGSGKSTGQASCSSACNTVICDALQGSKTLAEKADAMTMASGLLLADWQQVAYRTAQMDGQLVSASCKDMQEIQKCCPIAALMPETIKTVHGLLAEAARLDARFANGTDKPDLGKVISDEVGEAYEARCRLTVAVLNVMDKMGAAMAPAKDAVADAR